MPPEGGLGLKTSLRVVSFIFATVAVGTFSFAQPAKSPHSAPPKHSPDTVLVKPKKGPALAAQLAAHHVALAARVAHQFPLFGDLQIVKLPRGLSVEQAIERYQRSGLVEYAEPDYELTAVATPNDAYYGLLYGMTKISAPAAWDIRTSADPVIVAVIDTGVRYTHEDLAANMWVNPCVSCPVNGVVYSNDVYGINAINNTGDPWDDNFHGSHVAGTIGAVGNNGLGVAGVAWKVRIMALKFLSSSGSGYTSDAIKCINYGIVKGAKIMSNSWGGGGFSGALRDAITAAASNDVVFVTAAGNNNANTDVTPFYPADYKVANIVSVAATDQNDLLASFSNYGLTTVDLAAPGVSTYSCDNTSDSGYRYASGTSMATPHVAGAAALVRAQFPALAYSNVIYRILGTTDPLTNLATKTVSSGRLNVYKALTQTPRPLANFTITPSAGEPPLTVTFSNVSLGPITSSMIDFGDGASLANPPNPVTHQYGAIGTYKATLTVTNSALSLGGSKTLPITVAYNYNLSDDTFNWIDTSGMTNLTLGDDAYSYLPLPFPFLFYGQVYNNIFIGSNGDLELGSALGMTAFANADMPNPAAPNNIICGYWTDLDPSNSKGQIRVGIIGTAPNRAYVVSYEAVPRFASQSTFTFQVLLFEGSNDIKMQYLEVQPADLSFGAGRRSSVGVENSSGLIARKYTYNGSPALLSNNQALRFVYNTASAAPCSLSCPPDITVANALGQCGANVSYPAPTASGDCGTVNCSPASGAFFSIGSTAVNCSSTAGGDCSFTVTVTNNQPSSITCPFDQSVSTTSSVGAAVNYASPTVSDNCPASPVSCEPDSGSVFPIGTTNVICTATDSQGQTLSCTFNVTVTLVPCTPTAPKDLSAKVGGPANAGFVALKWKNTTTCLTGTEIERSMHANGVWTAFTLLDSVGPATTTYTDTNVVNHSHYRYRVRAFNDTVASPYSNTVKADL
jgi:subtilisin family serine protease